MPPGMSVTRRDLTLFFAPKNGGPTYPDHETFTIHMATAHQRSAAGFGKPRPDIALESKPIPKPFSTAEFNSKAPTHEKSSLGFGRPRRRGDADVRNDEQAWFEELNALEDVLKKAIMQRVKPCNSDRHTLRLAFQAVDFDNTGTPANSGRVSYGEFVAALERFGLSDSLAMHGLFDRYNGSGTENLNYSTFADGLYGTSKPWPPPERRGAAPEKWSPDVRRDAPPNRWENSQPTKSPPNEHCVRVLSLANPKHTSQAAPKWKQVMTAQQLQLVSHPI